MDSVVCNNQFIRSATLNSRREPYQKRRESSGVLSDLHGSGRALSQRMAPPLVECEKNFISFCYFYYQCFTTVIFYWCHYYLFTPGIWLPWKASKGQYITSGEEFKNATAVNLQRCMTRCLRDPTGGKECRAITISTFSDKTCKLRTNRVRDGGLVTAQTQSWQSFSRPVWYLGKCIKM